MEHLTKDKIKKLTSRVSFIGRIKLFMISWDLFWRTPLDIKRLFKKYKGRDFDDKFHAFIKLSIFWRFLKGNKYIYVDGFPRCANTYTASFLKMSNPGYDCLGRKHRCIETFLAIEAGIPTVILIRSPVDCICSHVAGLISFKIFPISFEYELDFYIQYYTLLMPYRKKAVVLEFADAIERLSIVKLNEKYNLSLNVGADLDENTLKKIVLEADNERGFGTLLSCYPNEDKKKLSLEIKELLVITEFLKGKLKKAESVYLEFLS